MTSGYFHDYIFPLLKGKIKSPTSQLSKLELYEVIVGEAALSIFVSSSLTSEDLKTKIISQSFRNINEHDLNYLGIHALNTENVAKVKSVLLELKKLSDFYKFVIKYHINEKDNIFVILQFE